MLFVTLCAARPGISEQAMRRRLEWRPPEGVKPVAEYWLPSPDPRVIFVTEGDDPRAIFEGQAAWDDVFVMKTFPAITSEEGLAMSREMFAEHVGASGDRVPAGI